MDALQINAEQLIKLYKYLVADSATSSRISIAEKFQQQQVFCKNSTLDFFLEVVSASDFPR